MKLLAIVLCIACAPVFAQAQTEARAKAQWQTAFQRLEQARERAQITEAINRGQPFRLPDNSLSSTVMATGIKGDDGSNNSAFTVTGIEIAADGLKVTADELVYHWDTHQIELRGNVHLIAASPPQ